MTCVFGEGGGGRRKGWREFFPLNRMSSMKDAFVGKRRGGVSERLERATGDRSRRAHGIAGISI